MASQRVRFQVLARDGFRCQYCGAASTDDGIRLEVDHILPRANGGTDDLDNLITACHICNRGKSSMVIEAMPERKTYAVELPPPPVAPRPPPIPRPAPIPVVVMEKPRVSPHPRRRLRRVPWSDDLFTDDQLAIVARVQRLGRPSTEDEEPTQ